MTLPGQLTRDWRIAVAYDVGELESIRIVAAKSHRVHRLAAFQLRVGLPDWPAVAARTDARRDSSGRIVSADDWTNWLVPRWPSLITLMSGLTPYPGSAHAVRLPRTSWRKKFTSNHGIVPLRYATRWQRYHSPLYVTIYF